MSLRQYRLGAALAAALLCCHTEAESESLSRSEAEARLAELKNEISALQEDLAGARVRYRDEQADLRTLDLKTQEAALALRQVETDIEQHQADLLTLQGERQNYLERLGQRREFLAQQIVAAYRMGRESRLKLLLNQDSPVRVSRLLAYYDHFSDAQAARIQELRTALTTLDRMQADIDLALDSLREVLDQRRDTLQALQDRRQERQVLLTALGQQIDSDQERLEELARNQSDLEALISRLTDALADIPTELGQYHHPRTLRGRLPMPLDGRVMHAFGQNRAGGMNWQGWLIQAPSGTDVHAIAYGRVAFADWLRGYGLLMIIDHGDGFMSLYGNNESLLFEPGDWVQPGQSIGTVGSNPGAEQGLYFELRSHGDAIDPAVWVKRS